MARVFFSLILHTIFGVSKVYPQFFEKVLNRNRIAFNLTGVHRDQKKSTDKVSKQKQKKKDLRRSFSYVLEQVIRMPLHTSLEMVKKIHKSPFVSTGNPLS